jgi:hypothetical protein
LDAVDAQFSSEKLRFFFAVKTSTKELDKLNSKSVPKLPFKLGLELSIIITYIKFDLGTRSVPTARGHMTWLALSELQSYITDREHIQKAAADIGPQRRGEYDNRQLSRGDSSMADFGCLDAL